MEEIPAIAHLKATAQTLAFKMALVSPEPLDEQESGKSYQFMAKKIVQQHSCRDKPLSHSIFLQEGCGMKHQEASQVRRLGSGV